MLDGGNENIPRRRRQKEFVDLTEVISIGSYSCKSERLGVGV